MKKSMVLAATVALLGTVAFGCSKKVPECNSMTAVINPAAEKLKKAGEAKMDKADEVQKVMGDISSAMDTAAAEMAKLQLTLPELQKFSTDYQAMAKETSAAAKDLAAAAKTGDPAKATDAEKKFKSAGDKEGPIIDGMNKFCQN